MRPAARMPKLTRRSRILIAVALAVVLLLLFGPRLIDTYVDWLWFGELGYRSVFTTQLVTRLIVGVVAGVLMGAIVFAALALAYRTRPVFVPTNGPNDPVARYRTAVIARLRLIGIGVPVVIGEKGVEKIIELELTVEERAALVKSAESVRGLIDACKKLEPRLA